VALGGECGKDIVTLVVGMPDYLDRKTLLQHPDNELSLALEVVTIVILALSLVLTHHLKALNRSAFKDKVDTIRIELSNQHAKGAKEVENNRIVALLPAATGPEQQVITIE
jgi:hypothetical protein